MFVGNGQTTEINFEESCMNEKRNLHVPKSTHVHIRYEVFSILGVVLRLDFG